MNRFEKHLSAMAAVICATLLVVFPAFVTAQETGDALEGVSLGELLNIKYIETATKHLMEARKAPAIAAVITADEIRNMGARNIMDILRTVPGLGIFKGGNGTIRIEVRGIIAPEKILILIDGHRANNNFSGSMQYIIRGLTVENIKRVEVIRGPASALYGANAFVGIINVITKTAEDIGGQQLSVNRGSFSTQHYNALFSYAGSGFQISGHADYLNTDGPASLIEEDALTGKPGGIAPGDTVEFEENSDFGLRIEYGDFSLRGRFVDVKLGSYIGAAAALNDESVFRRTQAIGDLIYTKGLRDNLDMSVRLYTDYYVSDMQHELLPEGFTGENDKGMVGNPRFRHRTLGCEITTDYAMGDHLITAGSMYETIRQRDVKETNNFDDLLAEPADKPDYHWNKKVDRDVWAIYLQNMWKITAYDSLILGIRHDNYNDFGGTINPRIGYVHEFRNDLIMKILYGSAFRAPTFIELYTSSNDIIIGNPDLGPEKISTYELSLQYPFLKNYEMTLSCFHNDVEDLIMAGQKPESGGPAEYISKEGKTRVNGVEAELDFHFAKDKYGHINVSYQNAEDENGKTLPDVAKWKVNGGLNYGLFKYLNANANVSWIAERPRAEGDPRDDLSSYTLVDLTLIAKEFYKNMEIRGSVYNLFDEDYRDPSPDMRVPNDYPTNRRMFLFEVRYKF